MHGRTLAYIIAILVVGIWSITFISTKVLLRTLTPVEIMFDRYVLAYAALWIAYPKWHKPASIKEELLFAGGGISGVTLYFLAENYALQYTLASNVGLLVATAPMLTVLVSCCFANHERFLLRWLLSGFALAIAGVFLVMYNDHFVLEINPFGDCLAILAAFSWACYSVLIKKIKTSCSAVCITRKTFFYALLTMLPAMYCTGYRMDYSLLQDYTVLGNLAFLGILASSVCFFLWNRVIWRLGPVTVNNFIYLTPLLAMLAAYVILDEPITPFAVLGGVLILSGVWISAKGVRV